MHLVVDLMVLSVLGAIGRFPLDAMLLEHRNRTGTLDGTSHDSIACLGRLGIITCCNFFWFQIPLPRCG